MQNSSNYDINDKGQELPSAGLRKPVRSETRAEQSLSNTDPLAPVLAMHSALATKPILEQRQQEEGRTSIALERHCSVAELSKQWGFSENTIRRLFRKEPGVVKIAHQETLHKRGYTSMRIPERVAQRVHRRLQGLA